MKPKKQRFAASDKRKQALKHVLFVDSLLFFLAITSGVVLIPQYIVPLVFACVVFFAPTLFFCWRLLRQKTAQPVKQKVYDLYAAEVGKFISTTFLFAISFMLMPKDTQTVVVFFLAFALFWLIHQLVTYYLVVRSK